MRFEFATATRVIFGEGAAATLPELARRFGTRPLVVTGASPDRSVSLVSALSAETFAVPGEPTVDLVREGARRVQNAACDVVISIGGGSVIDAGKAVATVATNGGEPLDFLEVVGKGRAIEVPPLPFLAMPTTAGTGSEVTRNAVLGSTEHGVKASLRSPMMLPRVALVDPELTYGLPPAVTASTGLDALTQLIEPYVSARANPLVDAICVDGIRRIAGALRRAYLGVQDTYYVGTIKSIGRIYQQTFIDTYAKVAFAKLYDRKNALVAADMLNDRVLPFYEEHDVPLLRILTDRGTEYCDNREAHECQLYLAVENIDHSRTRAKSPQTNGICERFHRTV